MDRPEPQKSLSAKASPCGVKFGGLGSEEKGIYFFKRTGKCLWGVFGIEIGALRGENGFFFESILIITRCCDGPTPRSFPRSFKIPTKLTFLQHAAKVIVGFGHNWG